jgi:hypothetical protein
MERAIIQIGSHHIGSITVSESAVRADKGVPHPHLVLPISIELNARPITEQLAIPDLWSALNLGQPADARTQVGSWVHLTESRTFLATSTERGVSSFPYELRIPIDPPTVQQLESHRHQSSDKSFAANVAFVARAVWVYGVGNSFPIHGGPDPQAIKNHSFPTTYGMFYRVDHFEGVRVTHLPIRISASDWVDKVLPGLGLDRVRLLELTLPRPGGIVNEKVIRFLDEAFRNFDSGRYRESISSTRDARNALEQSLEATKSHPIADVVVERSGLSREHPRRQFLFDAWSLYSKLTNAGPHFESGEVVTAEDARLALYATSIFLEYLASIPKN